MAPSTVLAVSVFLIEVRLKVFAQDSAIQACTSGVFLTADSGTITSANYPNDYNDSLHCRWSILASNNTKIQVFFIDFELESGTDCRHDNLAVFVGSQQVGTRSYCGKTSPHNFTAPANTNVAVAFASDKTVHRKGFLMKWKKKSACSQKQFTCWNEKCISLSLHCDGKHDCADNSDEIECARNSQDYRECGKSKFAPKFPWDYKMNGESPAAKGSYPWQAMLVRIAEPIEPFPCGGSVIAERWILTSAYCVSRFANPSEAVVYVGMHKRNSADLSPVKLGIDKFIAHPGYRMSTYWANDIGLVLVNQTIVFTEMIRPVCLQSLSSSNVEVATGTACIATGWSRLYRTGSTLADKLEQDRLNIVNRSSCTSYFAAVAPHTLCAGDFSFGGVTACSGDHGGPLVCLIKDTSMFQVGISTYGKCALRGSPGLYTKVNVYLAWINQVVKTYTPLLSLDYVKTTSSPPSTTHIITDDETSIPSSTTETGFSTQDITTATSRGSADTSVVRKSQTMRTEASTKTLPPGIGEVLPTAQLVTTTTTMVAEMTTPSHSTEYVSTPSTPAPPTTPIMTNEKTCFAASTTNTEVTTPAMSNESPTNGTAVARSLKTSQAARNDINNTTLSTHTTNVVSITEPAGTTGAGSGTSLRKDVLVFAWILFSYFHSLTCYFGDGG